MNTEAPSPAALEALHRQIEREDGPLADALVMPDADERGNSFGALVARGDRAAAAPDEYATLIESIFEGYLLHYGGGRILKPADPDLRLLAGDYLYAYGLDRLALIGDLEAVDELADLISLCAQAHAAGSSAPRTRRLTGGLWALAALAIATGGWPAQAEAKQLARSEGAAAAEQLLALAQERAEAFGLALYLSQALIAFDRLVGGESSNT
jgi:hypothetical protein